MRRLTKVFPNIIVLLLVSVSSISAQNILKGNKIPKDLIITLSLGGTIQFSTRYTYEITSDRKVFYSEFSNLPPTKYSPELFVLIDPKTGKRLNSVKAKRPQIKDKFSKDQIKSILLEFKQSDFFEMNDKYEGDPTLKEVWCVNHAEGKEISISANGETKRVYFFLGCSYGEQSPLKRFLKLYDKISEEISNVKKINLRPVKDN